MQKTLNRRQQQALQQVGPSKVISAADLLDDPEMFAKLNAELEGLQEGEEEVITPVDRKNLAALTPQLPTLLQRPQKEQRMLSEVKLRPPAAQETDPEAELEALNRKAEAKIAKKREEEAQKEKEVAPATSAESPEEALRGQILGALHNHPAAPTPAQILRWKAEHGDNGVYVLALNETDVFVFTYLRRHQWMKIQTAVANAQKADLGGNEDMLKEKVLQFTVLFPRPLTIEFFQNSRGGTIDTLFNVIMANSSFLQLNQAMVLTTQL